MIIVGSTEHAEHGWKILSASGFYDPFDDHFEGLADVPPSQVPCADVASAAPGVRGIVRRDPGKKMFSHVPMYPLDPSGF